MSADNERRQVIANQRIALLHEGDPLSDMRFLRQAQELKARGAVVVVWRVRSSRNGVRHDSSAVGGIEVREPPLQAFADAKESSRPVAYSRRVVRQIESWALPDLTAWEPTLIGHHHPETLGFGVRASRTLGVPLVSDFNDMPKERRQRLRLVKRDPSRFYPKLFADLRMRVLYPRAHGRMTASPGLADELARRFRVPRPQVVLNIPRSSSIPPTFARPGLREQCGLHDGEPLAVYVGNATAQRGFSTLLDAILASGAWHLAIVGSDEWRLKKLGIAGSSAEQGSERVHIIDRQPDSALPEFLSEADCGVFVPEARNFNLYHSATNKFFAMALAGIPLITADLPFIGGEVRRLELGIVLGRAEAVEIQTALDCARNLKPRVRASLERTRSVYAWESQAAAIVAVYEQAVIQHRHGASEGSFRRTLR